MHIFGSFGPFCIVLRRRKTVSYDHFQQGIHQTYIPSSTVLRGALGTGEERPELVGECDFRLEAVSRDMLRPTINWNYEE